MKHAEMDNLEFIKLKDKFIGKIFKCRIIRSNETAQNKQRQYQEYCKYKSSIKDKTITGIRKRLQGDASHETCMHVPDMKKLTNIDKISKPNDELQRIIDQISK